MSVLLSVCLSVRLEMERKEFVDSEEESDRKKEDGSDNRKGGVYGIQTRVIEGGKMGAIARAGAEESTGQQQGAETKPVAITTTQFSLWKQRKDAHAAAKAAEEARKRAEDVTAGRVRMTGRELFVHEPWVFDDSRFE